MISIKIVTISPILPPGPFSSLTPPVDAGGKFVKDVEGKGVGDGLVAHDVGMQKIARVVDGVQGVRVVGVSDHGVKVDHGVEGAAGADPVVDAAAGGQSDRVGVGLDGVVGGAEGRDGGREHGHAQGVDAGDHLLVGPDDLVADVLLCRRGVVRGPDVVDPFKDHGVSHPGLSQHVVRDSRHRIGTVPVVQQAISSGRDVGVCNGIRGRVLLHFGEDQIRPTGVNVVSICPLFASGLSRQQIHTDCSCWYHCHAHR